MKISGTILKKKEWMYYNQKFCHTTVIGCEHTFLIKEDIGEVGQDVLLETGEYKIERISDYYFILEKNQLPLHLYLLENSTLVNPFPKKESSNKLEKIISVEINNEDNDDLPF